MLQGMLQGMLERGSISITSNMDVPITVFIRPPSPLDWLGEVSVPPHSTIVFEHGLGSPEYAAKVTRLNAELDEYWMRDPRFKRNA